MDGSQKQFAKSWINKNFRLTQTAIAMNAREWSSTCQIISWATNTALTKFFAT